MKADYSIYDRKYQEARAKGWPGWGGAPRLAHEHIWLERLFSYAQVPQRGRVLELGCGEGHYARLLAAKGYQVTGVDVSAIAIQWAKEKTHVTGHQVEYLALDLTQPGILPGQQFDIIVDGNCVHCILGTDRPLFFANVQRLLKRDGLFFVSSLCSHTGQNEVYELAGQPYRYVPTETHLHRELAAAGFVVQQSTFHRKDIGPHSHCTVHVTKRERGAVVSI
jgi:2-polyprenyl-3-methyl-5-hydroxy-6-metoxy-1,4-benzoquinol methylase